MVRPIVQVSLKNFEQRKQEITKELWDAANDVGFFYLKDHGLTEASSHDRCSNFCTVLCGRPDRLFAYTLVDTRVLNAVTAYSPPEDDHCLQDEIQHMFSISKAFFDLPADVKGKYRFDLVSPLLQYRRLLSACFAVNSVKPESKMRAEKEQRMGVGPAEAGFS